MQGLREVERALGVQKFAPCYNPPHHAMPTQEIIELVNAITPAKSKKNLPRSSGFDKLSKSKEGIGMELEEVVWEVEKGKTVEAGKEKDFIEVTARIIVGISKKPDGRLGHFFQLQISRSDQPTSGYKYVGLDESAMQDALANDEQLIPIAIANNFGWFKDAIPSSLHAAIEQKELGGGNSRRARTIVRI